MGFERATTRRQFLAAASALTAACKTKHVEGYRGCAYVALAGSRSVAVVDLSTFSLRASIPLSFAPAAIMPHPDPAKPLAFVSGEADSGQGVVELADLTARRLSARILTGRGQPVARTIVHPKVRGQLWTAAGEPFLRSWSETKLAASGQVAMAGRVRDFDICPETAIACACLEGGLVQFVDLAAGRAWEPAKAGSDASWVRFRDDGRVALVACRSESLLRVFDTESRQVMTELPLALRPDHLCVKSDGGEMFITGEGRDAVVIVYPFHTEVAKTSLSGRKPGQMACTSSPAYLFVSNPSVGSVTVFDIETRRVVAVTGVGVEPGAIVITPDEQYALVLNRASGDIAVIRTAAINPKRAKRAPLFTMIPVGGQPVAAIVRAAS